MFNILIYVNPYTCWNGNHDFPPLYSFAFAFTFCAWCLNENSWAITMTTRWPHNKWPCRYRFLLTKCNIYTHDIGLYSESHEFPLVILVIRVWDHADLSEGVPLPFTKHDQISVTFLNLRIQKQGYSTNIVINLNMLKSLVTPVSRLHQRIESLKNIIGN